MDRQKVINVGQRRLDASRQRLVARHAQQWIEPDETPAAAAHARHFASQHLWVSAIPAVGEDQEDRSVSHDPAGPSSVEGVQRLADARAPAPVRDVSHDLVQRCLRSRDPARDPRQLGGEHERFKMTRVGGEARHEVKKNATVSLHRSADVADDDNWTRRLPAPAEREVDEFPSHQALAQQRSKVNGVAGSALPTSGPPDTEAPWQPHQQATCRFQFGGREVGEVLGSRHAYGAVGARCPRRLPCFVRADLLELDMNWNPWRRSNDDARPFAQRKQWQAGTGFVTCAEEKVESGIEAIEIVMTLDQKRFQRSPDVAPVVDTDPFQGADCVEQSAVVHVQARLTEQPAK